jgi:hypothetical protein
VPGADTLAELLEVRSTATLVALVAGAQVITALGVAAAEVEVVVLFVVVVVLFVVVVFTNGQIIVDGSTTLPERTSKSSRDSASMTMYSRVRPTGKYL